MTTAFFGEAPEEPVALYLDLIKRVIVNWVYAEAEPALNASGTLDFTLQAQGRYWPTHAHTMIGVPRLDNVQQCVETVIRDGVPGDLLEAGVWRGGAAILMRAVLRAHQVTHRNVWVVDSFEGLPPTNPDKYPADAGFFLKPKPELAIPLQRVRDNFQRYGLLDDQVRFLKGWFRDTLPSAPISRIAVLRLDGDLYESTMDAITALYPKVSPGGFVIIDDYGALPPARRATDDYRSQHGITDPLVEIDWTGVYWRKT